MARFGFCGGFYTLENYFSDAQMCMNWYPEQNETGLGRSAINLNPTPGLTSLHFLNGGEMPLAGININGRTFVVSASTTTSSLRELVSVMVSGNPPVITSSNLTTVAALGGGDTHASICANQQYVFIVVAQNAFVFNLSTNAITSVTGLLEQPNPYQCAYADGYFVVLFGNSNKFQISALLDPNTWNGLDVAEVSEYQDNVNSMIWDHRNLWLIGAKATIPYYDSGASNFPFSPIQGAYISQGGLQWATVAMDNSVFWIGQSELGQGIAWRASGFSGQRVSTYAIEQTWATYSTISDAIGWTYQDRGHTFWVIYFPTANATWVYDAATSLWHQRGLWLTNSAQFQAMNARMHVICQGCHIVGDWQTAQIYQMTPAALQDNVVVGDTDHQAIRRVRRAPYVSNENEWVFHRQFELMCQVGAGIIDPGQPDDKLPPTWVLRWSDDGTNSWSNEHYASGGALGEYQTRVIWRRLGRSRGRVYELSITDETPARVTDAYLKASPGFAPAERLQSQLAKVS